MSFLQPFPKLPVPSWSLGQPVALDEFKRVTDTYYKALEPARKLKVPQLPAQVRCMLYSSTASHWRSLTLLIEVCLCGGQGAHTAHTCMQTRCDNATRHIHK
jgi:hypothetical protein